MRTFAAIYLSTATDPDFRALHFREQHMYWTLLRQQKLNRAGLLDLNIYRWAQSADGMSDEHVVQALVTLAERRYVVIDVHSRELLIRTYVRNDGAYKNPKMMGSVVSAAHEIESPKLRRALLAEVDRIPLDELSDEPGKTGTPSIRARILGYVTQLRKVLEDVPPDGPGGLDTPDGTPTVAQLRAIAGVSDTHSDTRADTRSDGYAIAPGTRVRAHGVPSPEPKPEPEPNPLAPLASVTVLPAAAPGEEAAAPQGDDGALFDAPPSTTGKPRRKSAAKPKKAVDPEIAARNKLAVEIAQEWYDAQSPKPTGKFVGYQQIAYRLLDADHDAEAVAEAFKRCGFALTLPAAEFRLKKIQEERDQVVIPFQRRGQHQPYRNDHTKDITAGFPGAVSRHEGA